MNTYSLKIFQVEEKTKDDCDFYSFFSVCLLMIILKWSVGTVFISSSSWQCILSFPYSFIGLMLFLCGITLQTISE